MNTPSKRLWIVIVSVLLAACQPATPAPISIQPTQQPKLLATVFLSPTPNAAELQATRAEERPVATAAPATQPPTPTAYIGVFLGDINDAGGDIAQIDIGLLTLPAENTAATAAPVVARCGTPSDPAFGTSWSNDPAAVAALGCPLDVMAAFTGAAQVFERGAMYWRPTGEIWAVMVGSGAGGQFWYVPAAPADPPPFDGGAPEGLRVPGQGFGLVWRGVSGVRDAVGFARTDEVAAPLFVQPFERGFLLLDSTSGQVFALAGQVTGIAYGPFGSA